MLTRIKMAGFFARPHGCQENFTVKYWRQSEWQARAEKRTSKGLSEFPMLWGIDTICISSKKLFLSLFYCDKTPWPKQLIGKCCIWAHCSRGFESMTVMMGSMAAGRLFPGAVAKKSSHLDLQVQSRENLLGVAWAFDPSKLQHQDPTS